MSYSDQGISLQQVIAQLKQEKIEREDTHNAEKVIRQTLRDNKEVSVWRLSNRNLYNV